MRFVFLHWGFHGWSIYAIVAICLAYFNYRKEKNGVNQFDTLPLFHTDGVFGKAIDVIAIIATLAGIATTLGFGAVQMNGGISFLTNVPSSFLMQVIIIAIVTVLFLISASTGLDKGIRILSTVNMTLIFLMLVFFIIFGSTLFFS